MTQSESLGSRDVNELAKAMGVQYPVQISKELLDELMPNDFLLGLGIRYSERLKGIFSILRANLVSGNEGQKEIFPKGSLVVPFALAKGPFIKEELISIRAELKDDGDEKAILLSTIPEAN
jgi:hypothetical protein